MINWENGKKLSKILVVNGNQKSKIEFLKAWSKNRK